MLYPSSGRPYRTVIFQGGSFSRNYNCNLPSIKRRLCTGAHKNREIFFREVDQFLRTNSNLSNRANSQLPPQLSEMKVAALVTFFVDIRGGADFTSFGDLFKGVLEDLPGTCSRMRV